MTWKNALIPPMAIYAVIFLFISALIGFKIDQTALWVWIVSLGLSIAGLVIATRHVQPASAGEGFRYGLVWLVVFIVLDLILTVPFAGWDYFSDWRSYLPYLLTILIPTFWQRQVNH